MKKNALTCIWILISIIQMNAQRTITGIVMGDNGEEAIGANVVVDGNEDIGTVTEFDGTFSIDVPADAKALRISYTGFQTQTISIEELTHVHVTLVEGVLLKESVVIGYCISSGNYTSAPAPTFNNAIQGRSTGLNITSGSGQPGNSSGQVKLRKRRSITSINRLIHPHYNDPETNEQYAKLIPNDFIYARQNKFSTFSIDVDNASYSNVRRYINDEQSLPPSDAVRIEEMVNYFDYNYPNPTAETPFSVNTDLADCPWNTNNQLLRVGIKGYEMEMSQAPASNLVFLIDVSGSMTDDLELIKKSMTMLVSGMRDEDRVAIVVYAGNSGLVLPATSGKDKDSILDALKRLKAGGSTAGGKGIELAYKVAKEEFIENGNNRIILCTDGDFNVGISSTHALEKLIVEKRKDDIFLTVLGFGMGNYKDEQLEILANKGNGNYGYIDNMREAKKMLVDEVTSNMFTIAKDVKIQIEFNRKTVKSYRLIGYENRMLDKKDFNNDKKDAGELGAGHTVTALYEIVPRNKNEEQGNLATIRLRYKAPKGKKSQLVEALVSSQSQTMAGADVDFNFAAAVAAWGMLLKDSPYKGDVTLELIHQLIDNGMGDDKYGYRQEFKELVEDSALWEDGWSMKEKE